MRNQSNENARKNVNENKNNMARVLSFSKVEAYLKSLADKHVDIKDFCSTSPQELADKINSVEGIESPILIFFDYYCKLSGKEQRTFNNRSIAFSVLFSGVKADDFTARTIAVDTAEEIGLEVLSRINVQSKMPDIGWLYNNFEKGSANYNELIAEGQDGFYGMEFYFDLKTLEPLVVTPEKWSDGDIFCT
jgi:hypothetical protein